ncbi:predicted protein [Naegleria gruberi]|uniref:Predicted protein n=1 Tax=Naegleria gruberi TaxID=5762 RepID=D2V3P7_NAEGR|nr:uncharacterized protein NAEGRDRAFT_63441 [Naegleria gruberi]EFC48809.1 predicted protein [Naegleria gruberi]|eukprot:XP_002681553.1 predicted protein [Naegleria gruberi strain NEG-M]
MQLFESNNISISFKQAIESNYKYIIGSMAGRSESMIKEGVRKLPSPIIVNLRQYLVDEAINEKKQNLYLQFYLNCGSEVFCLLKHKQIKVKSGEYSYHVEEQLGKIERNEKKPTKPNFRLGVLVSTKYLVLDTLNFTRKFNKYRSRKVEKEDGTILCWVESNSFQSATRDEICKPKSGTKHSLESSSNSDDLFEQVKQIKLEFEQTLEKQMRLKNELEEKLSLLIEMMKDSNSNDSPIIMNTPVAHFHVESVSSSPATTTTTTVETPLSMEEIFGLTDTPTFHYFQTPHQQQSSQMEQVPTIMHGVPYVFSNEL